MASALNRSTGVALVLFFAGSLCSACYVGASTPGKLSGAADSGESEGSGEKGAAEGSGGAGESGAAAESGGAGESGGGGESGAADGGDAEPPLADVRFDPPRGFYDAPFDATITSIFPNATIFVTIDGREPTLSDFDFEGADSVVVEIPTTRAVRALVVKNDGTSPELETHTYIFPDDVLDQVNPRGYPTGTTFYRGPHFWSYEMDETMVGSDGDFSREELREAMLSLPTFSIVGDKEDILDSDGFWPPKFGRGELELKVSMEMIDPGNPSTNFSTVGGIEHHGDDRPKPSFRFNFRPDFGVKKLHADVMRTELHHADTAPKKFDRLVFRGASNESWKFEVGDGMFIATFIRDRWSHDTQIAMQGDGVHGMYGFVYLNGLFMGVYPVMERPDTHFAANRFGGKNDDYFATNGKGQPGHGDPAYFEQVVAPDNYQDIKDTVDLVGLSDYLILNYYMGTNDWGSRNFWVTIQNNPPGLLRFWAWDAEETWKQGQVPNTNIVGGGAALLVPWLQIWNIAKENGDFLMLFADRINKHCHNGGALSQEEATSRWQDLVDHVENAIKLEQVRYGDDRFDIGEIGQIATKADHWAPEVARVKAQMNGWVPMFIALMQQRGLYPMMAAPSVSGPHSLAASGSGSGVTMRGGTGTTIYYRTDGEDPRLPGGGLRPGTSTYSAGASLAIVGAMQLKVRARQGTAGPFQGWSPLTEADFKVQ